MNPKPRTTFLDTSTATRNDLDFSALEFLGELTYYDTTASDDILTHAAGAEVLITNKVPLSAETIAALPDLKLILVAATGYNIIDLDAARARNIPVCNVAGYSTQCVTQHVFTLLLNLYTSVHLYDRSISAWPDLPIFTSLEHPVTELAGKTMGIVGLGDIGSSVASVAEAFGMKVQIYERPGSSNNRRPELPRVAPDEFFKSSDVISLHCPLTPATTALINKDSLASMKPSAFLINTGRGPLVDEAALATALKNNVIAGAGLDVLCQEPPSHDNPLLQNKGKNLIITPHTAWSGIEAREKLLAGLVGNLSAFLDGNPTNQVN